jgi:two-component system cell cycle sensor histidine kinase/response regulator CckA
MVMPRPPPLAPAARSPLRQVALSTALVYVAVGAIWIVVSNAVLARLVPDRKQLEIAQSMKGVLFTLVTGALLYLYLKRRLALSETESTARIEAEGRYRILTRAIEQSPVSILITDREGQIQYVNPRFTQDSGYTLAEVVGTTPRVLKSGLNPDAVYADLWGTISLGREWHGELCNRSKDGKLFWEQVSISPVLDGSGGISHFVAVKTNITERRQLEEQMRRGARMEALGALASGVAHDLNNILSPILIAPDLLREFIQDPKEREVVDIVEQNAKRAADVVRQLLTFYRGGAGERAALQAADLVQDVRRFAEETFPRDIALEVDSGSDLPSILGDATQIHQVLLNLCLNARDAMPKGGTLTLKAHRCEVEPQRAQANPPAKPGPHIVLVVQDTGHGMTAEVIEHIFDPFFTTKELGKGTGLGLSTVIGIVRGHGGFVEVESTPNVGSTFRVFLPVASAVPAARAVFRPPEAPTPGSKELVLVVEDEALLREIIQLTLAKAGYRVVTAANGAEGLTLYTARPNEFDLVITDVMMPKMNGHELLRKILAVRADQSVLLVTGLTSEKTGAALEEMGLRHILSKPFTGPALVKAAQEALRREAGDRAVA